MAAGRAIRPEQPEPETAGLPGRRGPPETVPKEILKLWGLLPRRERQRRRRRFFRVHAACCSRPVPDDTLASLNARVRILEEALAEFLHTTAAGSAAATLALRRQRDDDRRGDRVADGDLRRAAQQPAGRSGAGSSRADSSVAHDGSSARRRRQRLDPILTIIHSFADFLCALSNATIEPTSTTESNPIRASEQGETATASNNNKTHIKTKTCFFV